MKVWNNMTSELNYSVLIFIFLYSIFVWFIAFRHTQIVIEKMYLSFFLGFTFVYSGAGIAFNNVSDEYITTYIFFYTAATVGLSFGLRC